MPIYEYECRACQKIHEIQQKIVDPPITSCPDCQGPVKKLVSTTSFLLKGGGWYADGYASTKDAPAKKEETKKEGAACPAAKESCGSCPAAVGAEK
jgi:putative FmdB family regulatory protein